MAYDSTNDTLQHINLVRQLLEKVIENFKKRAVDHDHSKLLTPEKEIFDEYTPKLQKSTYGSEEYKSFLAGMQAGLKHHYENNSHHPEHYTNGIKGMSLLDLLEMLVDWKAATMRHDDGDLLKSIEINQKRFNYSDELKIIFLNTVSELKLLNIVKK